MQIAQVECLNTARWMDGVKSLVLRNSTRSVASDAVLVSLSKKHMQSLKPCSYRYGEHSSSVSQIGSQMASDLSFGIVFLCAVFGGRRFSAVSLKRAPKTLKYYIFILIDRKNV
jgi:hypothetical protein